MFLPGAFRRADSEAELRWRNTQLTSRISEQQEAAETLSRVQGEIYEELYRYNRQGFREAIAKLNELLKTDAHQRNPALWVYLAAAHGQAYQWVKENETDPQKERKELEEHRNAALNAVRRALALGDSWKPILQVMWNPQHQIKQDGQARDENDLEVFYDDPEFKQLLG
jgi:hypothetical protein